ncbi:heterokaryon incompatibility protein-domain-containing protein [Xylariales sp. AK1849]|nr:heterokaryon incompatibility protein-domain-containing protein [Xylariales sp. AK1849]
MADHSSLDPTYRPLDALRQEIRLFELLPSPDMNCPIQGNLFHASLSSSPIYEALSYAWGQPLQLTKAIVLGSQTTYITPNLDMALRHLRLQDRSRTLWIDAVCINQQDLAERGSQVALMKQIYSSCALDLLWLGPNPDEESRFVSAIAMERGFALLEKIGEGDVMTLRGLTEKDHEGPRSEQELRDELAILAAEEQKGDADGGKILTWLLTGSQQPDLETVLRRPKVWHRIWIMQEVACAPAVRLVAGRRSLDWDTTIAAFLGDSSPYADAFHGPFGHGSIGKVGDHLFGRVQTIQHQRGIMSEVRNGGKSSLLDVLARFKYALATDPRDKIYGLLGLATDPHVVISYEKTAQQVYTDVTASIIHAAGNLDIICQSPWRRFDQKGRLEGLPSWAADFLLSGNVLLFAQRSIFNAGRVGCEIPCRISLGTILHARGVVLGRVGPIRQSDYGRIAGPWAEAGYSRWQRRDRLPLEWMDLYMGSAILDDNNNRTRYVTGEPAFTAFWRTLLTDCTAYPMKRLTCEEVGNEDGVLRDQLREIRTEPPLEKDDANRNFAFQLPHIRMDRSKQFLGLSSTPLYGDNIGRWTFTMTDNGLYTMIVPPAQEADLIVCLDGGKVPVVLRPSKRDGREGEYQLVTVAYVHGFMDMEATKPAGLREKLGLKEEDFLLA